MPFDPKIPKDYRPLVREAMKRGWTVTWPGRGHPRMRAPDGVSFPVPTTSRNAGLFKSWRRRLLRHPTFHDYPRT